ncbi:MAG: DNA-processing protein DprA [Dehalococcoidia bacterium]|nr:MAG: DNA-processing protein DprA [Dehalococcoidia bacterium]
MSDLRYWVGFNRIQGIGRTRFAQLESYFGDLEKAWHASVTELEAAGFDSRTVNSIVDSRPQISLDTEMEMLERHKVKALTWNDPSFPARLKEIYDVPPLLYVRGTLTAEDEWAIAVVGTRRATIYGRQVTERLASDLVHNRITIVSGLAHGIDAVAHRTALDAGGRTIAVLGCGLDLVYPAENVRMAQAIMGQGALISEYPLGTKPKAENFPRRNRIMSGLSLGVVVTEAGEGSGALITAHLALEQNREVFAVPGSILSPSSRGTNRLIQEGAKLVRNVEDILEELNLTMIPQQLEMREIIPADETESLLLRHLGHEPTHIDEACRRAQLPIATVSSTLAMMELKGMVYQLGGMNYSLARAD